MTEPEDLEEDLFADLYGLAPIHVSMSASDLDHRYDADDTANPANSAGATTKNVEPVPSTAPAPSSEPPAAQPVENAQTGQVNTGDGNQAAQNGGGHQNGVKGSDAGKGNVAASTNVEPEPQGTGIKEDG